MQNCKRNIFLYNKNDELVTYVDLDKNGSIAGYYSLNDKTLTKVTVNKFKEKNKLHTTTNKAIVVYKEECKLFHMFMDEDDSYCKAIKRNSLRIDIPTVASTVYSQNTDFLESYTINPSIVQDWLKKL